SGLAIRARDGVISACRALGRGREPRSLPRRSAALRERWVMGPERQWIGAPHLFPGSGPRPLWPHERRPLRLTIPGIPRTKKNSGRIVPRGGRHIILPSEAWAAWCKTAAPQIKAVLRGIGLPPIDYPVNCAALFYRDALR